MSKRFSDIDRAKGLAIILVVMGHVTTRINPRGNEWWHISHTILYYFHMPFFMFLSGFVYFYIFEKKYKDQKYYIYIKSKFERIFSIYIIFGGLILIGKLIFQVFTSVPNPINNIYSSLIDFLVFPTKSSASFLWYIYTLFLFYATVPLLFKILKKIEYVLLLGLMLFIVNKQITPLFCLNQYFQYLFFFSLGGFVIKYSESYYIFIKKYFVLFWISFIIILLFTYFNLNLKLIPGHINKLILGLFSIPALHGFITRLDKDKFLNSIGIYTLSIYLLHPPIMGVIRKLLQSANLWNDHFFYLSIFVLMISGVSIPYMIKKFIFPKFKYIDKITS